MQYFLPFWPGDDIYEYFEPWKDSYSGKQKRIWECFGRPPIDGILVSRVNIEQTNSLRKTAEREKKGIHGALRFKGEIMGDCGAFSYVNDPKPRYDPIETLSYYKNLGFDIGVTVDHLIVKTIKLSDGKRRSLTDAEREERWITTIEYAKKMFDEAQKSRFEKLRLIGVTQGWDPESYARGIRELLDYGFDYVGLGGLARKPTEFIRKVLLKVRLEIKRHIKKSKSKVRPKIGVHLFGVARVNLFKTMAECGVTSFDSASPLRTSWTSSTKNYILNHKFYTAIRIPFAKTEEENKEEEILFQKLRDFSDGKASAEELVKELKHYNPKNFDSDNLLKTLKEKPWEKCDCPICKETGIHTCIFRGCERNMRRGFHNVYQFHKTLREKYPRVLALTWCTSEKDQDKRLLPAYRRYSPSKIFRTFWNNVSDLPVDIGILSARYMLISWDTKIANYNERLTREKLQEAVQDLKEKIRFYDKVFFIGLGIYREAVNRAAREIDVPVEIYPKPELSRGKIDIIEYNRQMKYFREAVMNEIRPYLDVISPDAKKIKFYKQTKLKA